MKEDTPQIKISSETKEKLQQELQNYTEHKEKFRTYTQTIKKINDWINSGEAKWI